MPIPPHKQTYSVHSVTLSSRLLLLAGLGLGRSRQDGSRNLRYSFLLWWLRGLRVREKTWFGVRDELEFRSLQQQLGPAQRYETTKTYPKLRIETNDARRLECQRCAVR